ncbi:MAG: cell division protein FtsQ [Petroclostridium sp.]|nr:FtsQ-type protein [Clostridia bacterium]MDK2809927.1 cell division protein FtsQ [Petroclostridium sp.]
MVLMRNSSGNFITTTEMNKRVRYKKRTSRKFFGLLLLLIGVLLISLFLPVFNIAAIDVKGNDRVSAQDIIDASGIEKGINIFRADLVKAKTNIRKIPYIDSVKISRVFPNSITITVVERKPVGYIPFMGSYIFIDQKGNVLEVVPEVKDKILPVIVGLKFNEFKLGEVIKVDEEKKLEIIVDCVREIINNKLLDQISHIDVHDVDNIQLNVRKQIIVTLGDSQKIGYKMSFLKEILNELKNGEKGYIDLRNVDRVTFRPSEYVEVMQ